MMFTIFKNKNSEKKNYRYDIPIFFLVSRINYSDDQYKWWYKIFDVEIPNRYNDDI